MRIKFEGVTYTFPQGSSRQQIFKYLRHRQSKQGETNMATTYYGEEAVKKVAAAEGELTPSQQRIVELEGYATGDYQDHKGIVTRGVGQTGAYKDKTFKETFGDIENMTRRLVQDYDSYPEYLQSELLQAAYRGDLQQSPSFRKLLKAGDFVGASEEFLNHKEYMSRDTPDAIKRRLEAVSDAVSRYGSEQLAANIGEQNQYAQAKSGYYEDKDGNVFFLNDKGQREEV